MLRHKGEKAATAKYTEKHNESAGGIVKIIPEEIPSHLCHGDLMYDPDGYQGTTTLVVNEIDGRKTLKSCKNDSGYTEIPVEVTSKIEDPVTFYSNVCDGDLHQGVTMILLSPITHQAVLQTKTGGRPVHESREVRWTTYDGWKIAYTDEDGCSYAEVDLSPTTPGHYLCGTANPASTQTPILKHTV